MNDANPPRQYAEGGPDDERDPYAEGGYYQQQPYGYDAYGRPVQAPPAQQAPPPQQQSQQQQTYTDPYYDASQQSQQQPQQPYYQQPPQQPGYDTGQYPAYETGQQPPVYGYDTGQHTGQHTGYPAQSYDTGTQQPVYGTGQQPVYQPPAFGGGVPGQYPGYETGQQPPVYDETGQQAAYDTGQQAPVHATGQQPAYETGQQPAVPRQAGPGERAPGEQGAAGGAGTSDGPGASGGAGGPGTSGGLGYQTDQFSFLDEESEESDEVIDWLKFSESRTERREESRRRSRNRKVGLVVILVLALLGGTGYLWQAGKLPGFKKNTAGPAAAGGSQKRDVIVVHLLPVSGGPSSTALLVDNHTKKHGTTVLIPNSLQLTGDDGSTTTLDKSVDDGVGPTRDSLNTLLGTDIAGSWRLDSPYLELLVDSLGNVIVDTNTQVKGTGKAKNTVLAAKGAQQDLSGEAAVAYATYKAPGEPQTAQLARFGQVMDAVLEKMPSDAADATKTVQSLAQILDPSLTERQLGASLAQLADLAKTGAYSTTTLPVQTDGSLSAQATDNIVKDVLGGAVNTSTSSAGAQPRVAVKDATGSAATKLSTMAQAAIVNGGTYTYVPGGKGAAQQRSQVLYSDPARLAAAKDVAATLGLPAGAVKKGTVPSNADISVVLGQDYKPSDDGD